jgi:mRNA interferase RelE/StbE
MRVEYLKSFVRDLKRIKDDTLIARIDQAINEVLAAPDLSAVSKLKKMEGTAEFYRIRVGSHRIGIAVFGDLVKFVRCPPRGDIYREFP